MIDWLRQRRERHERDIVEARNLIGRFGREALLEVELRARSPGIDPRSHHHWKRIARIVRRLLGESD